MNVLLDRKNITAVNAAITFSQFFPSTKPCSAGCLGITPSIVHSRIQDYRPTQTCLLGVILKYSTNADV